MCLIRGLTLYQAQRLYFVSQTSLIARTQGSCIHSDLLSGCTQESLIAPKKTLEETSLYAWLRSKDLAHQLLWPE